MTPEQAAERDDFHGGLNFREMLYQQWLFQKLLIERGKIPDLGLTQNRIEYVKEQCLALIKEATEVLDNVGWKSWADSDHINSEAGLEELADVMCFMMNLVLAFGHLHPDLHNTDLIANRFARIWSEKVIKNIARQTDGQGYRGFGSEEER